MRHCKAMGLGVMTALALGALACGTATSASATTICVTGTITAPCSDGHLGGTVVFTSTNSQLAISGGGTVQCSSSKIHGTAPATASTWVTIVDTISYSNCTAFGFISATVTMGRECEIPFHIMFGTFADALATVTVPTGCTIDISAPSINCTLTVHGPSTISGTFTAGDPALGAVVHLGGTVPNVTAHLGGGFGCPTAGAHTATLTGRYSVTTPAAAPGITVIN